MGKPCALDLRKRVVAAIDAGIVQAAAVPEQSFGGCRYCATLKPKEFPNHIAPGRFLNRFEMSYRPLSSGALLDDTRIIRTSSEHAPLLRHSSGEHHHGTGTSV
jgi:hypothetical protein